MQRSYNKAYGTFSLTQLQREEHSFHLSLSKLIIPVSPVLLIYAKSSGNE